MTGETTSATLSARNDNTSPFMVDMLRDCRISTGGTTGSSARFGSSFTGHGVDGLGTDKGYSDGSRASSSSSYYHQDGEVMTWDGRATEALAKLDILRQKNELCDVDILVCDRRFPAHRVVLAASSPYFRAMFKKGMRESNENEIRIHDVDPDAMESLIDYCYKSRLKINSNNVQSLLPAACIMQMTEVEKRCCEFLEGQLDPFNCLEIRAFADVHSCDELLQRAEEYAQNNFNAVRMTEEFLQLDKKQLIDMINSDSLCVTSEEDVFKAVMDWASNDLESRQPSFSEVLRHVRLPLIRPKFLVHVVGKNSLIRASHSCRDLVDEAKNCLLLPQENNELSGLNGSPRLSSSKGEQIIFVIGGWCTGDAIATVEAFDPIKREWKMMANMAKTRCGVGLGVVNNLMYAVGGHDGIRYLNTVERYDIRTNTWNLDISPTSSCRTSVGVGVLDGKLYAVGGQDGISCLNVVEVYDPNVNRWTNVQGLHNRRLGAAVAVSLEEDRGLYAIGGSDGVSPLGTVEFYDPRVGRWFLRTQMNTNRKHLGAAALNGYIYAVGGRDHIVELSSVERYNPKMDLWTKSVSMISRRSGVGLAAADGKLAAVGGFDGTNYLNSVELFSDDSSSYGWELSIPMNHRRLGSGVGVVSCYADISRGLNVSS